MSSESPSGGETCALDEVLPSLSLALVLVPVPVLPLPLVVEDASAGDADLSRIGDMADEASGTWADIFGRAVEMVGQVNEKGQPEAAAIIGEGPQALWRRKGRDSKGWT